MKIINPANNEVIGEMPHDNIESVTEKLSILKKSSWANTPLEKRVECLKNFSNSLLHEENFEKLAKDLTLEVGKPLSESRNELRGAVKKMEFFLKEASDYLNPEQVNMDNDVQEIIDFSPLGVVANISAWNYPYLVGINIFVPALLTGNTVLYKPSEHALLTGKNIQELLYQSGVPKDAFIMVIGDGSIGREICGLDIDGLFFTGSFKTGQSIAKEIAPKLIPLGLELGGKDPLYVTDEVDDIKQAALNAAEGAFYNNGQSCCSVERIYVHKNIYEEFLNYFVTQIKSLIVGDPMEASTNQGALARKEQLNFLEDQVRDAVSKGAKVLCGGKIIEKIGNYFEPTVLSEVNHSMKVMKEESFGPIIGIQKVDNDEEAIELMNNTDFGLTSAVYTNNHQRGKSILSKVDSGTGYLNCCDRVSGFLPWAGRKNSGYGLTLSKYGLLPFLKTKSYHFKT